MPRLLDHCFQRHGGALPHPVRRASRRKSYRVSKPLIVTRIALDAAHAFRDLPDASFRPSRARGPRSRISRAIATPLASARAAADINRGAAIEREHILRRARHRQQARGAAPRVACSDVGGQQRGRAGRLDAEVLAALFRIRAIRRRALRRPWSTRRARFRRVRRSPCTTIACSTPSAASASAIGRNKLRLGDAEQLATRPGGICQRRHQVEHGANPQRAAQGRQAREHRMIGRREDEAASGLRRGIARSPSDRNSILIPELLEHVGGADSSADRAIAMLGDRHAGRRRNQRGAGRDVESAGAVAAGAGGIEHIATD